MWSLAGWRHNWTTSGSRWRLAGSCGCHAEQRTASPTPDPTRSRCWPWPSPAGSRSCSPSRQPISPRSRVLPIRACLTRSGSATVLRPSARRSAPRTLQLTVQPCRLHRTAERRRALLASSLGTAFGDDDQADEELQPVARSKRCHGAGRGRSMPGVPLCRVRAGEVRWEEFLYTLRPALRAASGRPRPAESRSLPAPEPPHASRKANRSALMVSACVVGMPWGKPR
jgi:hypothetical protein